VAATAATGQRLRRLARASAEAQTAPGDGAERCELCGELLPPDHRHLVDVANRRLLCGCRACGLLFDHGAEVESRYRLVPDRRLRIVDFALDDAAWEGLRLPVDMAFFFSNTPAGRVTAFYPSPAGATESLLELGAWRALEEANPVLGTLVPDVEALLIDRARGRSEHWIVPIDECYRLVGLMRTLWKGLSGGAEVWSAIDLFFEELARRGRRAGRDGTVHERAPAIAGGGKEAGWTT
jgi:hypothetical protein